MSEAPQDFKPEEAVTFLANFGHDPEALKTRDPVELKDLYDKTNGFLTTHTEEKVKAAPVFKDNWREAIAGDDAKALETLKRFTDPSQMYKSYAELRTQRDTGQLKAVTPFPKEGKPEEQAAWREQNGIPAEPAKYMDSVKLAEGLVIGENDKPFVDDFLATAHAQNLPPEVVNGQLNWYFGSYLPQLQQAQGEKDVEDRTQTHITLHEKWGADFKGNMNAVGALLQTLPEGLRDNFYGARLPDGTAFANSPDVMQWMASMARELDPASSLTPAEGATAMKGLEDQIAAYEKRMKDDRQGWNKDKKANDHYMELLDLRAKAQGAGKKQAA